MMVLAIPAPLANISMAPSAIHALKVNSTLKEAAANVNKVKFTTRENAILALSKN